MLFYYFLEMYSGLVISSKKSLKKVKNKKSTKRKAKDINANQSEDIDRYAERDNNFGDNFGNEESNQSSFFEGLNSFEGIKHFVNFNYFMFLIFILIIINLNIS